jgi:uncharacterized protein YjbI with pentapeptide repeats
MTNDDLSGQNLDHVNLSGANLSDSDLSKSSLRRSHLKGTNLQHANLEHSDLHGAHLEGSDVAGADLRHTDFSGAHLHGVDLGQAASTEGITLTGARGVSDKLVQQAEADRVVSVRWEGETRDTDNAMGDRSITTAQVEHVARALAREAGFHAADWENALTEQERERYRRDASAALASAHQFDLDANVHDPGLTS